jgi:hypothetical protein
MILICHYLKLYISPDLRADDQRSLCRLDSVLTFLFLLGSFSIVSLLTPALVADVYRRRK